MKSYGPSSSSASSAPPAPCPSPHGFRTDIQALRAVAVLLVLGFHIWPAAVTGGYVGVDVFFVISGYLITGHLLREVVTTGRVDLPTFYARRAQRLLPAASLTLVGVGLAAYLWMPVATWATTAADMAASTVYAQNWALVRRSVDYLAQDQAPSPLQHFWSLSVEEQFYLGWPLLVGWCAGRRRAATAAARHQDGSPASSAPASAAPATAPSRHRFRGLAAAMAAVCVSSFIAALYYAAADPAPGYFLTTTRLWEMGMGGLVALWAASLSSAVAAAPASGSPLLPTLPEHHAVVSSGPPPAPAWLAWARLTGSAGGLAAILAAGALYTTQIPFPGAAALVPTLGAAAFIMAGEGGGGGPGEGPPHAAARLLNRALSRAWVQYVGDVSYSLYLAHWPVVVLFPYIVGRPCDGSLLDGARIGLVSWALAHACKRGWEDRFRTQPPPVKEEDPPCSEQGRGVLGAAYAVVDVRYGAETKGGGEGGGGLPSSAKQRIRSSPSANNTRAAGKKGTPLARAAWMAGLMMATTLALAGGLHTALQWQQAAGDGADSAAATGATAAAWAAISAAAAANQAPPPGLLAPYPGAEAMVADAPPAAGAWPVLPLAEVIPPLAAAAKDAGPAYTATGGAACIAGITDADLKLCDSGAAAAAADASPASRPAAPKKHVVILGDSHAAHWLPAFYTLAAAEGWRVTGLTKGSCPPSAVTVSYSKPGAPGRPYTECDAWRAKAVAWVLAEKPDAVVFSGSRTRYRLPKTTPEESTAALAGGLVDLAREVAAAGIPVAAIKHTPSPGKDLPLCLATVAAHGGGQADAGGCAYQAGDTVKDGWIGLAATQEPGLALLTFDDAFCEAGGACPAVAGNTLVLRDTSHMTATFSRSLAPALKRRLGAALPGLVAVSGQA